MSHLTLEQRVADLEKQMAQVKTDHANGLREKPWLRTMGIFAGDEGMREIFAEALKVREQDRRKARGRGAKKSAAARGKQ
jgi:hypothetical protein